MTASNALDIDGLIEVTSERNNDQVRRRQRLGLAVSAFITLSWLGWVTAAGHWSRVIDHWASAVTMVFGSFVAGSTPQGGGAVAFPVFTKVLQVPSEVARTFSLAIQSVGMTAASCGILINRRSVDRRALAIAVPLSVISFVAGVVLLSSGDRPFGPSVLPGAYVKVTFTVIVAAMAFVTWLGYRNQLIERRDSIPPDNLRVVVLIASCAIAGGIASALVGSGSDVFIYLAIVSMIGLSPRVGVATSVLVMTAVSLAGLVMLAIGSGHLAIELSGPDAVAAVGQQRVALQPGGLVYGEGAAAPASRYDLFGLWLAAVPVVAWGAPLGSAVSARATDRQVVKFVIALAMIEVVSTIVFLDDLRTNGALVAFAVLATALGLTGLWFANRHRHALLRLPRTDVSAAVTRSSVDVGPRLDQQLRETP